MSLAPRTNWKEVATASPSGDAAAQIVNRHAAGGEDARPAVIGRRRRRPRARRHRRCAQSAARRSDRSSGHQRKIGAAVIDIHLNMPGRAGSQSAAYRPVRCADQTAPLCPSVTDERRRVMRLNESLVRKCRRSRRVWGFLRSMRVAADLAAVGIEPAHRVEAEVVSAVEKRQRDAQFDAARLTRGDDQIAEIARDRIDALQDRRAAI